MSRKCDCNEADLKKPNQLSHYRNSAVYIFNVGSDIIMSAPTLSILDVRFLEHGDDDPFPFHSTCSVEQLKCFASIIKGMFSS